MSRDLSATKKELRSEYKRWRAMLSPEACQQASTAIGRHIEGWEIFQRAATVLTYMPMRNEVDLTPLLACYPRKQWAIPRTLPGGQMTFHGYDPAKLVRHAYGMLEPAPGCAILAPEAIQLVFVPGLAFDQQGWRLGYGGGFYDRFLCDFGGVFAGITYRALLVEQLPHADHDISMPFLISEAGILACAPARSQE
jgi:5,10-methenyltetrahydrofolate synthetase